MDSLWSDKGQNEQKKKKNGEEIESNMDNLNFVARMRNPNSDIHKMFLIISESAKRSARIQWKYTKKIIF